jgi:hypothetical protein
LFARTKQRREGTKKKSTFSAIQTNRWLTKQKKYKQKNFNLTKKKEIQINRKKKERA